MREHRRLFWAAVWLAMVLLALKAYYLGAPQAPTVHAAWDYICDLAAISFIDVLYAALLWAAGAAALRLAGRRPWTRLVIVAAVDAVAATSCLYALASVLFFNIFGGFLTYPLLSLVGDVHMIRSSVEAQVSAGILTALVVLPLGVPDVGGCDDAVVPGQPRTTLGPGCGGADAVDRVGNRRRVVVRARVDDASRSAGGQQRGVGVCCLVVAGGRRRRCGPDGRRRSPPTISPTSNRCVRH